jgi:hypothetical protein
MVKAVKIISTSSFKVLALFHVTILHLMIPGQVFPNTAPPPALPSTLQQIKEVTYAIMIITRLF